MNKFTVLLGNLFFIAIYGGCIGYNLTCPLNWMIITISIFLFVVTVKFSFLLDNKFFKQINFDNIDLRNNLQYLCATCFLSYVLIFAIPNIRILHLILCITAIIANLFHAIIWFGWYMTELDLKKKKQDDKNGKSTKNS